MPPSPKQSILKQLAIILGLATFLAALVYGFLQFDFGSLNFFKRTGAPQETNNSQTTQKFEDDQKRKNDIFLINSALQAYFLENKQTPKALSTLSPKYLAEIPKDPESKDEYLYRPSTDQQSWKVSTILSDGKVFEASGP